jgi:hypothetical protein
MELYVEEEKEVRRSYGDKILESIAKEASTKAE